MEPEVLIRIVLPNAFVDPSVDILAARAEMEVYVGQAEDYAAAALQHANDAAAAATAAAENMLGYAGPVLGGAAHRFVVGNARYDGSTATPEGYTVHHLVIPD